MKQQPDVKKTIEYTPPRILNKGQLKQFAGSPLAHPDDDSLLSLPGQH